MSGVTVWGAGLAELGALGAWRGGTPGSGARGPGELAGGGWAGGWGDAGLWGPGLGALEGVG